MRFYRLLKWWWHKPQRNPLDDPWLQAGDGLDHSAEHAAHQRRVERWRASRP